MEQLQSCVPIRVLIADNHPLVLEGFRRLISLENDIEITAEATDAEVLASLAEQAQPDVIMLELHMLGVDAMSAIEQIQRLSPRAKIVIFTGFEDRDKFVRAMRLGVAGVVLKTAPPQLVLKSIRKVHAGEVWLDSQTTAAVMQRFASSAPADQHAVQREHDRTLLSKREHEVVLLVAQGYRNKEIAERMFISEQTVKNHLHNVFDKLGVSDRLELALYVVSRGLHNGEERHEWPVPMEV